MCMYVHNVNLINSPAMCSVIDRKLNQLTRFDLASPCYGQGVGFRNLRII